MKKVRWAIAVGALPTLGMAVAPAAAHAATPAAHMGYRAAVPTACSGGTREAFSTKGTETFTGHISWAGCSYISSQLAHLPGHVAGLTERVRYRNAAGTLLHQSWLGGFFINSGFGFGGTEWTNHPNRNAHQVCQALVANSNHNNVRWGPVCETV